MTVASSLGLADLLSAGRLADALVQSAAAVKANPNRQETRLIHAELCVLSGDLEKADLHARFAQRMAVGAAAATIGVFRHVLRGLDARGHWWREGAVPMFPGGPTAADRAALTLNIALRDGEADAAAQAAEVLAAARGAVSARWNGADIADLRDLDDRLPHAFEVISSGGQYLWVDIARVSRLDLAPPKRPFDLCCRAARLHMRDGGVADVWMPAVYPDPAEDDERLARSTAFAPLIAGLMRGSGQRLFLADGGAEAEALAFLDAQEIVFAGGADG
jgi:type VI secretion system protein ImpE